MLTPWLIACLCRFQCLTVYSVLPAAFFCVSVCVCVHHTVCVCAGIAMARPSVWAELRKWAGRHVALRHLGPRVPITDGPLTLAQALGQLRHHMERKRERVSWHSQLQRMKRQQHETLRWKTHKDTLPLLRWGGLQDWRIWARFWEMESGDAELREMLENSQENGGFIPWNHRWDHLSLLAWINHIPGSFHTGKSVFCDRDSHKSNLRSRSIPGTELIAYIQWLLLHRHKFIRQPCLNPPLQHGLKVKVWSWMSDAFLTLGSFFISSFFKQPCQTDHSFFPFSFSHPDSLCSLRVCGLHY